MMSQRDILQEEISISLKFDQIRIDESSIRESHRSTQIGIGSSAKTVVPGSNFDAENKPLRRSIRIELRNNRRKTNDMDLDVKNNNMPAKIEPVEPDSPTNVEFELEYKNVHYLNAIKTFTFIESNQYKIRFKADKSASGRCECQITNRQIASGMLGCGGMCLHRIMDYECDADCALGNYCSNQRFKKMQYAPCTVFIAENKGYGLFASRPIPKDTFIIEFVGEVISDEEKERRYKKYDEQKIKHRYAMIMKCKGNDKVKCHIDATKKGNLSRFINHSCDPNAQTDEWLVAGKWCIGVFSKRPIKQFEEITYNYQFTRHINGAQKCYCGSKNCVGTIG